MTDAELKSTILAKLADVAPEIDPAAVGNQTDLRNDLDLDSMDFLNFVIGLSEELGLEIPERDYPRLATIDAILTYVRDKGGG
ncbi:MAG: acyl carrier protein [Inquilinaceae bacterium]